MSATKVLIIRFSSFGDIAQCLCVVDAIKRKYPNSQVHWAVRSDLADIVRLHPGVDVVWPLDRDGGMPELRELTRTLEQKHFDFIYDAHRNLRSAYLMRVLGPKAKRRGAHIASRSKERLKRFLLFRLHWNLFPKPFRGMISYLKPLEPWGIEVRYTPLSEWRVDPQAAQKVQEILSQKWNGAYVAIAPSAAWEMKRWPLEHWKQLVCRLGNCRFAVLGGPNDGMCEEIADVAPERTLNLAGKLTLVESCIAVLCSSAVVSADTGILHIADLFGRPTVALLGPTAFGYPTGPSVRVADVSMACRPCTKDGRGTCRQGIRAKCMLGTTPEQVGRELAGIFQQS